MKIRILLISIVLTFVFNAKSQTTLTASIMTGGVSRSYILYIPAIYNAATPVPLVFNFHGYTSTNSQQLMYGDFRPIADTANFIIVLPQGLDIGGGAGWHNFDLATTGTADMIFVENLLDTIISKYNIDQNRVYSTGMSNGGFMSYDLACFMNTRFAAIASVTGSMVSYHMSACNPSRPVPVMEIHGTADATVAYSGTGGILSSTNIDSLVNFWIKKNDCDLSAVYTALPDISTTDLCTAQHYVYNNGNSGSSVELFKIINGGHTWPGAAYNIPGVNTNHDFNASSEIWRFFSQYKLNDLTSIKPNSNIKESITVYPNPFNDVINIKNENNSSIDFINIINMTGKVVYAIDNVNNIKTINTELWPSGVYLITVRYSKNITHFKMVK